MTAPATGVVVVTDRAIAEARGRGLVDVVAAALDGGARDVLLREKDLGADERTRLAAEVRDRTAAHGAALWVAGDADLAVAVGADGVHLAAADPWPDTPPVPSSGDGATLRIGRSCHTVAELAAARRAGADRATYSPVFASRSKPGYGPALGVTGLAAGCAAVPDLDVVALGGVEPGRARRCVAAGACAVALMGAVMRADDPAGVVRTVIDELRSAN
jgi:thiamine-phosphate pyrophosphorylase